MKQTEDGCAGVNGVAQGSQERSGSDPRLARAMEEYQALRAAGEKPDHADFLARYPEVAGALADCLSGLDFLHAAAPDLSTPATGSTPTAGPDVGAPLGDFRLIREVGRGGMGIVYEAEQISLGRHVALKVLPFAATMDPRHLQRFQNEARAAASLHHTNIVPVHGVGCERGVHYYAMQFIEGRTLADFIAQQQGGGETVAYAGPAIRARSVSDGSDHPSLTLRALKETAVAAETAPAPRDAAYYRRVAEWGIQAAEALDHAHTLGIIHRDVKPANLMVDAAGRLWITDFGLAHVLSDTRLTMTGDLVGTLRYMSPEQALAKRVVVDHRTDVYSLGATLYELLALRPVFEGSDRQELLRQIAFEEPKPPRRINKAIPVELEIIVLKSLEKNPAERYATAGELADDLRRLLMNEPIRARRPTLVQRARKWARRHNTWVTAVAAALVVGLAVLAGGVGWVANDQSARRKTTAGEVRKALKDSAEWQRRRQVPSALTSARQAMGTLVGGEADDALLREVEARLADLELPAQLDDVRLEMAASTQTGFDYALGDRRYGEIFRARNLDMDALSPGEVAEHLRATSVAAELAAALDDWAIVRRSLRPRDDGVYQHLLQIACAVDQDKWRTQLRAALASEDRETLVKLASADEAAQLLPLTMNALSATLVKADAAEQGEALLRTAQRQHPDNFLTNYNLAGLLLSSHPAPPVEAVSYLRAAVALRPENPLARSKLGAALGLTGDVDGAIAECTEAIRLNRNLARAHTNLGAALEHKGDLKGALAEYREAVRLKEDDIHSRLNLGAALWRNGDVGEAISVSRETVNRHKDHAGAHNGLASALQAKGDLDGAIAAYQEAIRLNRDYAGAYTNLGNVLRAKGEFIDALAAYRRGLELEREPHWSQVLTQSIKECERLVELDAKLPKVLKGEVQPADAGERLALAQLCQLPCKSLYAVAVRFYTDAFAQQKKLADDLQGQLRYNAACAAALAGCGQGKDADQSDDKERGRFRHQALEWLRADLAAYRRLLDKEPDKARPAVRENMQHWQQDTDFAGVRGPEALAKLPEAERQEWQQLWADVADTLAQAGGKAAPGKKATTK